MASDDEGSIFGACAAKGAAFLTKMEATMPSPSPVVAETVMDFYDALRRVIDGEQVRRQEWPPLAAIFMHNGLLYLRQVDGALHTLIVSDGDLRGTDWVVTHDN